MFVPGGTGDKKLEGIFRNCFFFSFSSSNMFFAFVHLGMEEGEEEALETIVIQLLNLKFNL